MKAHLFRRCLSHLNPAPLTPVRAAPQGVRISLNIFADTATSAIWNVTEQSWLTTLAPILITIPPQAGKRPRLDRLGHRQRRHEFVNVVGEGVEQ
jgi:hypothetical protein